MEAIQKAVISLENRNEQECLRWRYIDVIEDEDGNRKRLTWRDVALRVYQETMRSRSEPQPGSTRGRWRI